MFYSLIFVSKGISRQGVANEGGGGGKGRSFRDSGEFLDGGLGGGIGGGIGVRHGGHGDGYLLQTR